MFNTEEIIGDIIYISFKDQNRYSDFGIVGNGHFLIKGYDNIGIWVEHPNLILSTLTDEKGKPLPEHKIQKEKIDANFLITWDNVDSLMHYPNRKGFDFPSEFNIKYGFKL